LAGKRFFGSFSSLKKGQEIHFLFNHDFIDHEKLTKSVNKNQDDTLNEGAIER